MNDKQYKDLILLLYKINDNLERILNQGERK